MRLGLMMLMAAAICGTNAGDLSLTVYNQNLALVREIRELEIASGISTLSFTDVAARIDPTSVHFRSLTDTDRLSILEQNYEYDLVGGQRILEKYVDREIRVLTEKGSVFTGKLLSAASDIVIQTADGAVQVIKAGAVQHFDFPKLPEGLITRPTLVWLLDNRGAKTHKSEISYLTEGLNWHAEYVAVADQDDRFIDIGAWVSIENQSGADYENARLKLVAGDVNRVEEARPMFRTMALEAYDKGAEPQFEEKAFFEYHLYTLQRRATVKNNQTKQISLFPAARTAVKKIFIYDGGRDEKKVRVHLEFKNSKSEGLGLPLPKGKIRVYKKDDDGSQEFVGEDRIDHTPADEKMRILLGNAFDLTGERVQQSAKPVGKRSREEEWKITLRNHKKEAVEITVQERFQGDWSITQKSHDFRKKDARTAEFTLPLAPSGEVVLNYTVLLQW
ncbi:DUF4139 domain-containing protein [bacterium]|nr:DUF4139 domain-containing protein [bacterium]